MTSPGCTARVSEVRVERDQDTLLLLTRCLNGLIGSRRQTFLVHIVDIEAQGLETLAGSSRHVLVELESQGSGGNRYYPLVGKLSGKCKRGGNVLRTQ